MASIWGALLGKKSIRAASNVCSPIELSHDAVKPAEAFIVLYLSIIDSIPTTLLTFPGNTVDGNSERVKVPPRVVCARSLGLKRL